MMRLLALLAAFGLGALAVLTLFAFAFFVATDPAGNLTLHEARLRPDSTGGLVVTGALRNNTGRTFLRVLADIEVIGPDGAVVERTYVTTTDLAGGTTWTFVRPVRTRAAARAVVHGACGRAYAFRAEAPLAPR